MHLHCIHMTNLNGLHVYVYVVWGSVGYTYNQPAHPGHAYRVRLFSAGSPRVGNQAFSTWAGQILFENWRMTHFRDPVVHLPPT